MYMHIFVRGIRGNIVPLGVDGSDTIADLKEWIENLFGYPQERQTLVFEGKVLHDDCRSVADYRFQEDSTVFIQLAPDPQFSKTSMSMQQKTSLKRKLPPLMPGAYKAIAEALGLKPKEVKSAVEGVFALTAEQVKKTGPKENRKTKKAYTKKNSQKHEDNEIKEKKSGLGNFLFGKICHRFFQNGGFRARRGFSSLGKFHFGKICH